MDKKTWRTIIECSKNHLPPMYWNILDITYGEMKDGTLTVCCEDNMIEGLNHPSILGVISYAATTVTGEIIPVKIGDTKKVKMKQEEHAMYDSITVSCRGFTGELKMLVKTAAGSGYNLSIRDTENAVTHVLENVKPNEIKLVSGRVTMGG